MLQNQHAYQNTQVQLAKIEAARREAQQQFALRPDLPEIVQRGHLNGLSLLIDDLQAQLIEYESLRGGGRPLDACEKARAGDSLRARQAGGKKPPAQVRAELLALMEGRAEHAPLSGDELPASGSVRNDGAGRG